ncbi:hypothetical protein OSB04_un000695 [Centaurea solstitialis]|uniref:Uncharacterized protein n=1 Tax=Centaurea solstitialis TaxID=347529 RepID=A0AA38SC24_9ASTR|nr:hypothetical protein OSB04_un000695 [Centaurea solstitialis]
MISIDDHPPPPDPSSSHDLKINNGDQKAPAFLSDINLLKSTDLILDDTNNPLPNFSIRDYVFGSRSKNIASNWPFSHESLQLCLQYGVKNLLPPFQSLDLMITNPSGTSFPADNHEEILTSSDGKLTAECHLEKPLAHTKSKKPHPAASPEKISNTANQTTVKKCKIFTKLNPGVEEEVAPNNFIISETMLASKVCPVCKTFSSSSNTKLNAHIDRCLSEESSTKWTKKDPKIIVKHRIKPRKTRFMVDIYKTAPCCTVEELDRRNGTSWATNSSFPDQELEFQAEETKLEAPTFVPEVITHHEGTVYIDTNGTKVRILSMPEVGAVDDQEARKLQKGGKGKKKKAYETFKLNPNSKKFKSLKPHHPVSEIFHKQAISGHGEEERCDKEGENPMKARVHNQTDDLAITRPPWACSKRTVLPKKRRSPMSKDPKEFPPLQDTYKDPLGITSNGEKFSSLHDNPSRSSQEHDAGSKKPRAHCLSTENLVLGPSQDSSKQKSTTEKDTSDIVDQGSFMGLKNSFDDEFSMMVTRLGNKFDIEKQDINYFHEVDPIPIPGPPGSFLPLSPGGDMVSEELQANSSLTTTSRFQSSEEQYHHDMMDKDSISDSPISTVSSSSFARSDDKLSARFANFQDTNFTNVVDQKSSCLKASNLSSFDAIFTKLPPPPPLDTVKPHGDESMKLPFYRDCESAVSPSAPVLRLMGKNLTVVNSKTDDDHRVSSSLQQFRPPNCSTRVDYDHQLLHNVRNNDHTSFFYGNFLRDSVGSSSNSVGFPLPFISYPR